LEVTIAYDRHLFAGQGPYKFIGSQGDERARMEVSLSSWLRGESHHLRHHSEAVRTKRKKTSDTSFYHEELKKKKLIDLLGYRRL